MQLGQLPALFCFLFSLRVLASRILRGNNNNNNITTDNNSVLQCVSVCVEFLFVFTTHCMLRRLQMLTNTNKHERTRESPKKKYQQNS